MIYLDDVLDIVSKGLVVILDIVIIFGCPIKIKSNILFVISEELILQIIIFSLLFRLFAQDYLNFFLVRIILLNSQFIIDSKFTAAVMEKISWWDITTIVLAHAKSVNGEFL